ncbi:helix-turn-helix domain-containing protein [Kitasatospora indigofera]|uniref:helix-turn-helix domain-containing protein n=1 Tax=Kitasatospora indigofera TaxID=67307 RepID=UPI003699D2E4
MLRDAASPEPRRKLTRPAADPKPDPRKAFSGRRTKAVRSLDEVVGLYPDRRVEVSEKRKGLEFYSTDAQPNAFAMDSQEFLFIMAQYYRGNVPLRLVCILIANQQAGGVIELTQEQMADILDVHRTAVNDALSELTEHGIVVKITRGSYRLNPVFSYRGAALRRLPDGKTEFVQVEQADVLDELRRRSDLPDRVRYPSLDALKQAIDVSREERAQLRRERARERRRAAAAVVQSEMLFGDEAIEPDGKG